jgi:hypothetical protein
MGSRGRQHLVSLLDKWSYKPQDRDNPPPPPSDNGLGKIGILQFEYKLAPASPPTPQVLYWDLSDLDGVGGGLVGSPFHNENVKATPYNNGTGLNGCHQIRCPQGKLCRAAYDTPNDVDTRVSLFFLSSPTMLFDWMLTKGM